jgi:hypothetical protein
MRLVACVTLALTLQPLPSVVFVTERGEIEIEVDTVRAAVRPTLDPPIRILRAYRR